MAVIDLLELPSALPPHTPVVGLDLGEKTIGVAVSDLTRPVEWRALLKGVDAVVHLAGIAHAGSGIAEEVYDRVNRLATAELANAARASWAL